VTGDLHGQAPVIWCATALPPLNSFSRMVIMQILWLHLIVALFAASAAFAAPAGDSIFFDGRTYYEVPQAEISVTPSNFSVSCWVKTTVTNSQIFLNMGEAGTGFTLYRYNVPGENSVRMLVEHNPSGATKYLSAKGPATPTNVWFPLRRHV
jgi:hypothetical protein